MALVFRITSTPWDCIWLRAIEAVSASSMAAITWSSISIWVTFTPNSRNNSAISMPIKPAPTTSADFANPERTLLTRFSAALSDLKL
jgi:hypothetical protein